MLSEAAVDLIASVKSALARAEHEIRQGSSKAALSLALAWEQITRATSSHEVRCTDEVTEMFMRYDRLYRKLNHGSEIL